MPQKSLRQSHTLIPMPTINDIEMPVGYEVSANYEMHNEKNIDTVLTCSVLGFHHEVAPPHLDKTGVDCRMQALSMPVTPLSITSASRRHSYHSRCATPSLVPCSPPIFAHAGILESALKTNSLGRKRKLSGGMDGKEGLADYALMFDD